MNTQLRIAFVLAFSLVGGAALAEDGGAAGTPQAARHRRSPGGSAPSGSP